LRHKLEEGEGRSLVSYYILTAGVRKVVSPVYSNNVSPVSIGCSCDYSKTTGTARHHRCRLWGHPYPTFWSGLLYPSLFSPSGKFISWFLVNIAKIVILEARFGSRNALNLISSAPDAIFRAHMLPVDWFWDKYRGDGKQHRDIRWCFHFVGKSAQVCV